MEEEKTLVIPLGGSTADGERVSPTGLPSDSGAATQQKSGKAQTAEKSGTLQKSGKSGAVIPGSEGSGQPDQPKKPHVAARIFGALGALVLFLIVVAVIGGGVLLFLGTRDEMPKAPEVKAEMSDVIIDSAMELISDKRVSFNSDEVNLFLKTLEEKSSGKASEYGVEIDDLFSVVANDKATFYCRLRYKGFSWPIRASAKLAYDNPYIIISLESAYVGNISIPSELIIKYFEKVVVSDNISVLNGMIYYDTTEFNDKIAEVTIKQLGLEVDKNNEEDKSWWQSVKDWFKEKTAGIVSDMIHNVEFENVTIIDNEIVIQVTYDKAAPED